MRNYTLPCPPTINHYYGRHGNRTYIKQGGKDFRLEVKSIIGLVEPFCDDIYLKVDVYFPDKRKRDLDNILKALQDALAHARVYKDDTQIAHLEVRRAGYCKAGKVVVFIDKKIPA